MKQATMTDVTDSEGRKIVVGDMIQHIDYLDSHRVAAVHPETQSVETAVGDRWFGYQVTKL